MIVLALATTLTFGLPRFGAQAGGCAADSSHPLVGISAVRVYGQRQAPEWSSLLAGMSWCDAYTEGDVTAACKLATWRYYWPNVRDEAAPVLLRERRYADWWARPGTVDTVSVDLAGWTWRQSAAVGMNGRESCRTTRRNP